MKKLIAGIILALIALLLYSWLFIPANVIIETQISFKASPAGLIRRLSEKGSLAAWWPGETKTQNTKKSFLYHGTSYTLQVSDMSLLSVELNKNAKVLKTRLYLFSVDKDSTKLVWLGKIPVTGNLFSKIYHYQEAKNIKSDIETLLGSMAAWYSKSEHVYGSVIHIIPVSDTSMIAIFSRSKTYPGNSSIYAFVSKLQQYAETKGASQSGYPMVNIKKSGPEDFSMEVALPINKVIESSASIVQKRLPPGKILETEIKGGTQATIHAIDEIKNYGLDRQMSMYVIPYYSLITNRITEPDSSRWITKVLCPIF